MSETSSPDPSADSTEKHYTIADLFRNDTRFQMWGLFSMYPELSLADLSRLLHKSKSTIHPHLKILEDIGIITEVREEKVRGKIKAKIYSLAQDYHKKFTQRCESRQCKEGTMDREFAQDLLERRKNILKINIRSLQMELEFYEKLNQSGVDGPDEQAIGLINDLYKARDFEADASDTGVKFKKAISSFGYLSEDLFIQFQAMYMDMFKKIQKMSDEEDDTNPTKEKPYYFFFSAQPLKQFFEYLHPRD